MTFKLTRIVEGGVEYSHTDFFYIINSMYYQIIKYRIYRLFAELEKEWTYSKQSKFHTAFTNLHLVRIEEWEDEGLDRK